MLILSMLCRYVTRRLRDLAEGELSAHSERAGVAISVPIAR
jgi:hypothetical protein